MKRASSNFILYYDEKCPLCLSTISFIKRFIAPRNTEIKPLGKAEMDEYTKSKALKEMLLTDNLENKWWGYYTYAKLFSITSYKHFKPFYSLVSFFMKIPLISYLGISIFNFLKTEKMR